jgi:cytidylate kinase
MRIITVSRQFGSGGREVGERLAEILGWDYYDKEIIERLADEHGVDAEHVRHVLSHHGWQSMQLTYRNSFSRAIPHTYMSTQLMVRQREIIREIAEAGNDCIIVGRDADVILKEEKPFRIFICADMEARLERTMAYEQRRPENERLTEKEVMKNIRRIDKNRIRTREILTGRSGRNGTTFDLTLNAAWRDIPKLAQALADFSLRWFEDAKTPEQN